MSYFISDTPQELTPEEYTKWSVEHQIKKQEATVKSLETGIIDRNIRIGQLNELVQNYDKLRMINEREIRDLKEKISKLSKRQEELIAENNRLNALLTSEVIRTRDIIKVLYLGAEQEGYVVKIKRIIPSQFNDFVLVIRLETNEVVFSYPDFRRKSGWIVTDEYGINDYLYQNYWIDIYNKSSFSELDEIRYYP